MFDLPTKPDQKNNNHSRSHRSAWRVYSRLVGYAFQYKGRLALSILFSLVIAVSFASLLVGVGTIINLTFYDAPTTETNEDGPELRPDPAIKIASDILHYTERIEAMVGWAPQELDTHFLAFVQNMREDRMRALKIACVMLIVLTLFIGIARFLQEYFAGAIGSFITTDLASAMYRNLMQQSVGFFEARKSGEIMARFTNDIFMVNNGLAGVFTKLMREPVKALTFLLVALRIDPWLTIIGLCVLPPMLWVLLLIGKKMRKSVRRSLQKVASMASVVNETVRGISIVKSYSMEKYETARIQSEVTRLRYFLLKMVRLNAITGPLTEIILVIGLVAFILLSGQRVLSGELGAGDLVSLYLALAMMLDPVRKLSSVNNLVQTSVASAERVFEFIDMKPEIVESANPINIPVMSDELVFDNVDFSYDGNTPVLQGITFQVKKGELVALVGFSGAGKSTLIKLLPRFYDVTQGQITLDGVDIRQASFRSLRDQIGLVTQDTLLFAESIKSNIAFGMTQYTDEQVQAAARAANADGFIESLPEGYNTMLGESGVTLSGGQRQRLAIARAFLKDPAILILDEATSSLDSESERLIQDALDHFLGGRTAIVIAHRLSTIQRADRIIVLDQGRIVDEGNHETLMVRDGIYQRLYATQFGLESPPNNNITSGVVQDE